jgi:hypothetical protein
MRLLIPYKARFVFFMSGASVRFSRRSLSDIVTTAYNMLVWSRTPLILGFL